MKFTMTKLAFALPLAIATMTGSMSAIAAANMSASMAAKVDSKTNVQPAYQQNITAKRQNAIKTNRYFVLLKDAPVALYGGSVKGLAATSVAASKSKNATKSGKLNTKSAATINYKSYLNQRQSQAKAKINSVTQRSVPVKENFSLALNCMVMELNPDEVAAIEALPEVIAVTKEERHQLHTDRGPSFIGATNIWDGSTTGTPFKGEGMVVGIMDTGITSYLGYAYDGDYSTFAFHPSFTDPGQDGGEGYDHTNPYGEGVYFGMCVDKPEHCNDKLVGIVSYPEITNEYSSWEIDQFGNGRDSHGHGTHVASTVAGNPVTNVPVVNAIGEQGEFNFEQVTGVAPNANIISYQTCHPTQGCWPSLAIKAIEHAMENNVDVMNYSVGGSAASPWYLSDALALLSAREAGIHIAVSAGNSGPGEKTVGSPGNSPWVTTVAAYTHDRDFTDKTATFSGGTVDLSAMTGKGATSGISGELVYAGDIEDEYSKENHGDGVCGSVTWSEMEAVQGKVLICNRGGNNWDGAPLARVDKSRIAKQWGAAGMILINTEQTSDSVDADFHSIPTIHLNKADGEQLLAWLASGEGHSVSFNASELVSNPDAADIAGDFSSRGPDLWEGDYLVPDIAAPGVAIFAGGIGHNNHYWGLEEWAKVNGDFRFMSGTSMSSPHVAGALTLLAGIHPDWTPAEAQSAIMMTAERNTFKDDDYSGVLKPSTPFDAGAGSMRIHRAVQAGLVLNETRAGYLAADPFAEELGTQGDIEGWHGEPSQMNMPSLAKKNCLLSCTWTRTFKGTKAGSWTIQPVYDTAGYELSFSPSSFTITEGQEVSVEITAAANSTLAQEWAFGKMVLVPSEAGVPEAHLPVAVNFIAGIAPEHVDIITGKNQDSQKVEGVVTVGTDNLQVAKTGLTRANIHEFTVERDATNNEIVGWQGLDDTVYAIPLNVQARTKRLVVDVLEVSSPDIDLYVGFDANLDGKPDAGEFTYGMKYISGASDSDEQIDIIDPEQGTYWVLVHNWAAPVDGEPTTDTVKLSVATVKYDDETMTVDAPKSLAAGEEADMSINWNNDMIEGELYYGAVQLGTAENLPTNIGTIRVSLTRDKDEEQVSDKVSVKVWANKKSAKEGQKVKLYAVPSGDWNYRKDLTYTWTQTEGPTVEFGIKEGSYYSRLTVVAPEVDEDTNFTFSVVAKKDGHTSQAETISFEVKGANSSSGGSDNTHLQLK